MNEINPSAPETLKRFGTTCRLLAIFCVTALGFQANVAMALPALYVHYDASDSANVTVDGTGKVTNLADLSANTYDATSVGGAGTILYTDPGNLSPTGLKGVDTNDTVHNKLLVLTAAEQEALLNFSGAGAAASNTGFAALVVFKADTLLGGSARDIVLSSHGNSLTSPGSFIMRYQGGIPELSLGNTSAKAGTEAVVVAGETVVLAVNYDKSTGTLEVWDSENNTSASVTRAADDFSSTQSMYLAGSQNGGQGMDGMIGEVKLFQGVLTAEEFTAEQTALVTKWLGAEGEVLPPADLTATGGDSQVTLDWSDDSTNVTTSYAVYRSTTSGSFVDPAIDTLTGGTFASEFIDTGLTNGTTYYYQVEASDGSSTAMSNEVQALPTLQGSSLYAHYDASDATSVTLAENTNVVTALADLSGNGYHAEDFTPIESTVLYPDAIQSTLGLDLLDMGESYSGLRALLPTEQDALLDFTGAATGSSGFSLFVVARVDALLDGSIRDVILGNSGNGAQLSLRLQGGRPELWLGTVRAEDTIAAVAGDTLVLAANYDRSTETLEFWNSKANASVTVTVPAGDFSAGAGIYLGTSNNSGQYMDGAIGEVKFYQGKMSAEEFAAEQDAMYDKWLAPTPIEGASLYAHYDATDVGSVTLDNTTDVTAWNDISGNAFNASADGNGSPIQYPSASVSSYGVSGLGIPDTADSKLLAFTDAQQDEWLDFSSMGAAEAYSGFTMFAVVKPDAVGVTSDVVLASHGNPGAGEGLSLRYTDGRPRIWFAGTDYNVPNNDVVAAGETVILAVRYDSDTGELRLYDSESGNTGVATVTATNDFSSSQSMFIAGSLNNGQGMDGMFGELKIYRGVMTDTEYEAERDALMAKWVQNAPVDVTAGADASDITLAWVDPNPTASLTYSVYRSEVSGTYTTALASGLPSTNYTDSSVVFGTTYYYVVTATRDGIESGFSAEVLEATTAASALYAHYDASDATNVTLAENTNEVTDFADLSGNNYNADEGSVNPVLYPDAIQSATGLDFLDMGASNNRLRTLLPPEQDALLNFAPDTGTGAGEAAINSGFSFFVVARVDALLDGIIRDVVLGNAGDENAGLVLKLAGDNPELHLGGVEAIDESVDAVAGDTLVFAANYNNVTQQLEFWNSKANASVTVTVPAADFSTGAAIFIGGSNNPDQYLDGAIGEVKFYEGRMSSAAFAAEQLALSEKWITGSPSTDFTSWVDGSFTNGTLSDKTAGGDDDNDGISNLIEFAIEGEDPTVSNTSVGTFTGLTLSFNKRQTPVISGISYTIEQSTDLGVADAWEAVAATEDASSISFTLPGGIPKDFMRLQVTEE